VIPNRLDAAMTLDRMINMARNSGQPVVMLAADKGGPIQVGILSLVGLTERIDFNFRCQSKTWCSSRQERQTHRPNSVGLPGVQWKL
jgi:hypothetical protein